MLAALRSRRVFPSAVTNARLVAAGIATLSAEVTAERLLRRPRVTYAQLRQAVDVPEVAPAVAALVEIAVRYAGSGVRRQTAHTASPISVSETSPGGPAP